MSKEILRPSCLKPIPNTFCPGCLHSMANKLVGQCIDELGLKNRPSSSCPSAAQPWACASGTWTW